MSQFHAAVDAVLQNWTALQFAVSQGAGGAQSAAIAKWMVDATVQWFAENKDLDSDEVEDFLLDIVNNEFNVLIDDGSVSDVSKLICEFYRLDNSNAAGRAELTQKLEKMPKKCDLSSCKVAEESNTVAANDAEEDDNDEMEVDSKPQQDPDGWTVVSRKKK